MRTIFSLIAILIIANGFSQNNSLPFLDSNEISNRFNSEVLLKYNIDFPIYRVYEFSDIKGTHELVLTENPNGDKSNDSIKAFCFLVKNEEKTLEWKLTDFIVHPKESPAEKSIQFWTKYLRLEDLDDDGIVDPIIVYGTNGMYGIEDGRLKILIYLNGTKHGIRHKNSGMDFGRNTTVDKSFYALNERIQLFAKSIMSAIEDNGNAIFPAGWEDNMKKQQLYFDENQQQTS